MKKTITAILSLLAIAALSSIVYCTIFSNRWNSIGDTKMAEANREQIRSEQEKQTRLSLEVLNLTLEKEQVLRDAEKLKAKIGQLEALQRTEKPKPKSFKELEECQEQYNILTVDLGNCIDLTVNLQTYIQYLETVQETDKQIIRNQEEIIASKTIENGVFKDETRRLKGLVAVARKKTKVYRAAALILSVAVGALLLGK